LIVESIVTSFHKHLFINFQYYNACGGETPLDAECLRVGYDDTTKYTFPAPTEYFSCTLDGVNCRKEDKDPGYNCEDFAVRYKCPSSE
jgi:hypothetical protein